MRLLSFFALIFATQAYAAEFEPGQVWSYKTRPLEPASTITVLKVEQYPDLGRVIHLRVDGIKITNPKKGNVVTDIPHLPFKEAAVKSSVTALVKKTNSIPEFQEGYNIWKEAYVSGKGGAFGTPINTTLDSLLKASWEEKK